MIVCPHDRPQRTDEVKVFVTGLAEHREDIDEAVDFARQQALLWVVGMAPHRVMPSGHVPRRDVWRRQPEANLNAGLGSTAEGRLARRAPAW